MAERMISEVLTKPDAALEMTLRPSLFSEFTGQAKVKERLEITVAAAKQRNEAIDHILLSGPPGLGKTTLANIIAKAMGANLKSTSGPTIEKAGDLAGLLTNLEEGDVLFIDEIHLLPRSVMDYLCLAMADFKLDIIIDQGPSARAIRLNLPRFTVIGTTTRRERLLNTFVSCFPIVEEMGTYTVTELAAIVSRFSRILNVEIDASASDRIANCGIQSPLGVLNRFRRVRDFAQVKHNGKITFVIADEALQMLSVKSSIATVVRGRDSIPSEVRREVWRRDEGKCVKCGGRENLEYDHIIPVSRGGSNSTRNIELLCESCNRSKGNAIE